MSESARGETFVMKGEATPEGESPVSFTAFLLGLASAALIHTGVTPHPDTGGVEKNLMLARQSVDLLSMLREKTRGNLTPDEDRFFDNLLADLRMQFVEATRR